MRVVVLAVAEVPVRRIALRASVGVNAMRDGLPHDVSMAMAAPPVGSGAADDLAGFGWVVQIGVPLGAENRLASEEVVRSGVEASVRADAASVACDASLNSLVV